MSNIKETELQELINIGKTLDARLRSVGIETPSDLVQVGAVAAFERLTAEAGGDTLPVCYNLYSLQGAIDGRNWRDYTDAEKAAMREAAGV